MSEAPRARRSERDSTAVGSGSGAQARLPGFADELIRRYRGGTVCEFLLHGNIHDLVGWYPAEGGVRFTTLKRFLAEVLFAQRDTVIYYDLATGIHFPDKQDLSEFHSIVEKVNLASGTSFESGTLPKDPLRALFVIERYLRSVVAPGRKRRRGVAVILDFAELIADASDPSQMSAAEKATLVTLAKWAGDPDFLASDITVVLLTESLSGLHPQLVRHPFTAAIEVPLPDRAERLEYLRFKTSGAKEPLGPEGLPLDTLATLTGGLSRVNLLHLVDQALKNGDSVRLEYVQKVKKELIEKACQGMLEFYEPRFTLDHVAGHRSAKAWLANDAALLAQGQIEVLPMGYLICGPVGTGKTFLIRCFTGSIGIPCALVKNLRSQWQGVTEANWERLLTVLKATGPIGVVIDEADAALGDRNAGGDSGTSGRIFSMVAQQMADTAYRGVILWFLLTCRPDLLPVDLKRQGRAEVHIPLFYPHGEEEATELFRIMAKKVGARLEEGVVLPARHGASGAEEASGSGPDDEDGFARLAAPGLSGADMEGVLVRARRIASLRKSETVSQRDVDMAFGDFVPSVRGEELELQMVAALMEVTDLEFLPPELKKLDRVELGLRLRELKLRFDRG